MKTTAPQTLALILAVALAVQGVIPDAWPHDSIGWLRLVVALVAIVCTALLRSPVLASTAPAALALLVVGLGAATVAGCSQAVPVGSLITPVSVHCDVLVSAIDGGTITMNTEGTSARWFDHYCGSDPSGGVDQSAEATTSPVIDVTAPISVTP